MSKITPENINSYYDKINKLIDDYFGFGISPSALQRYFKKGGYGLSKFLKRHELNEIDNSEKIVHDIVEDRVAMEEGEIMTYENFAGKYETEPRIISGLKINFETGIQEEKYIADIYRVSLGHVKKLENNHYKLTGLKFSKEVYIYNQSQIEEIIGETNNLIYEAVSKKSISIDFLNMKFPLKGKIEKETFTQQMDKFLKQYVNNFLPELISHEAGNKYILKEKTVDYYLLEKVVN